jgi:hypothetical protein
MGNWHFFWGVFTMLLATENASAIDISTFELPSQWVHRGKPRLHVFRLPSHAIWIPYSWEREQFTHLPDIKAWSERLQRPIVVNAGQYDVDLRYIGQFKAHKTWLYPQRKKEWMGLLVSGPLDPNISVSTRIVDLQQEPHFPTEHYAHVVQSMMLLDQYGKIRIRKSEKTACRTIFAEDRQGRMLILLTEGAISLYHLAVYLRDHSTLALRRAMNMDGGLESQLALTLPNLQKIFWGKYGTQSNLEHSHPAWIHVGLPFVVAIHL